MKFLQNLSFKMRLVKEMKAKTQILAKMLYLQTWVSQKSHHLNLDMKEALNPDLPGQKSQIKTSKNLR